MKGGRAFDLDAQFTEPVAHPSVKRIDVVVSGEYLIEQCLAIARNTLRSLPGFDAMQEGVSQVLLEIPLEAFFLLEGEGIPKPDRVFRAVIQANHPGELGRVTALCRGCFSDFQHRHRLSPGVAEHGLAGSTECFHYCPHPHENKRYGRLRSLPEKLAGRTTGLWPLGSPALVVRGRLVLVVSCLLMRLYCSSNRQAEFCLENNLGKDGTPGVLK